MKIKIKTKSVTVGQALRLRDYLTDENQHTNSTRIECWITFTHNKIKDDDMWLTRDLSEQNQILDNIDATHTKEGSMNNINASIRKALYYQAIMCRNKIISDDDMCLVPLSLYNEYLEEINF